MTSTPDPAKAPRLFELLAGVPYVTETRLHDWNVADAGPATVLFEVEGDSGRFRAEIEDVPGVRDADLTPIGDGRFYLLLRLQIAATPLVRDVLPVVTRDGVVVVKPVVYRDERIHARVIGDSSALQSLVAELPPGIDVEIHSIGEYDTSRRSPASRLSDRQQEAVLTAFELGYYDHPRRATHADVAERMDCASNTASEHLQKAEAKLLESALEPELRDRSR